MKPNLRLRQYLIHLNYHHCLAFCNVNVVNGHQIRNVSPRQLWHEWNLLSNFNGAAVKICECMNDFIPYFIMHVMTYPCHIIKRALSGEEPQELVQWNGFNCKMGPFCLGLSVLWWRHQMETVSALLAFCAGNSPVTGEFPAQGPVTRSFDVFFDLRLDRKLSKQWKRWWFETPPRSLWCHCSVNCRKQYSVLCNLYPNVVT